MPGDVHGRRADAHLSRLPREDTFVCRLQEQVSTGGRTRGRQLVFAGIPEEELVIR
jgi:hypothetical protein